MTEHFHASQSRTLIFGAGAVGICYILILQQADCQVAAVCRSNYSAAKKNGFSLNSDLFGQNLHLRPYRVVQSRDRLPGQIFDFLLVTTKAFLDTSPSIAELIRPFVSPGIKTIALLQNGIKIVEEYAKLYPHNPVLSCVVNINAVRASPTHVDMGPREDLEIGPVWTSGPSKYEQGVRRAEAFASLIRLGGGTPSVYREIQPRRWLKLLINATWNPICALTQLDDASLLKSSPLAHSYVREVMNEVANVAHAQGHSEVTFAEADHRIQRVVDRADGAGYQSSMATDARHKRPMEVDAILGNLIKVAREQGVEVRQLKALYVLTCGLDEALQTSDYAE